MKTLTMLAFSVLAAHPSFASPEGWELPIISVQAAASDCRNQTPNPESGLIANLTTDRRSIRLPFLVTVAQDSQDNGALWILSHQRNFKLGTVTAPFTCSGQDADEPPHPDWQDVKLERGLAPLTLSFGPNVKTCQPRSGNSNSYVRTENYTLLAGGAILLQWKAESSFSSRRECRAVNE